MSCKSVGNSVKLKFKGRFMKWLFLLVFIFLSLFQWVYAQATAEQYLAAGNKLFLQKNYDKAEKYYKAAIQVDPNNWKAHQGLGNVYYAQGQKPKALSEYQTALKINPNNLQLNLLVQKIKVQDESNSFMVSKIPKIDQGNPLAVNHFEILTMGGLALSSVSQIRGVISGFGGEVEGNYLLNRHFGIGVSIGYNDFDYDDGYSFFNPTIGTDTTFDFLDFLIDGKYRFWTNGLRPYLLGGVGFCDYIVTTVLYNYINKIKGTPISSDYSSSFYPEISGGVGLEYSLFSDANVFIQGKYNLVLSNTGSTFFVPIDVGVNMLF
jgi:hypothetical protein